MINLTSLLLYLLTSACGAGVAQDVWREVVIKKGADGNVKALCEVPARHRCCQVVVKKAGDSAAGPACCAAGPHGPCCEAIIKKAGAGDIRLGCCGASLCGPCCPPCPKKAEGCRVGTGCCGAAAPAVFRQLIIKETGDLELKTPNCGAAPDLSRRLIIKKAGDCDVTAGAPDAPRQLIIKKVVGGDVKAGCCGSAGPDLCRQLIVTSAGDSGAKAVCGATALAFVGPDDEEKKVIVRQAKKEGPKVWIGVRVSPVPEPLACHLKRGGLMIANVAKDSPADRAGIERYDVVVSFADDAVEDMDDLIQAIGDTGVGNTAEIVVIRGGREKTLTITPIKGGDPGAWVMKYEEPEEPEVDQLKEYFGGRLKVGPGDVRIFVPYGELERLPEDVKEFLENMPEIEIDWGQAKNWEEWSKRWEDWSKHAKDFKIPFDIEIDVDADDSGGWGWTPDKDDVQAEIHIRVKEDGETITIERSEDGGITIEREGADGHRSSETYEDVDQLRKEDPEAYKTYRRLLVLRSPREFIVSPDLEDLGLHQHEFQIELKAQLDKARQQVEEAMKQVRKARKQVEIRKKEIAGDKEDVVARTKNVMILVEDGHITLEITEDGVSKKYEFDSSEDFKNSEPELYERFGKHLDR